VIPTNDITAWAHGAPWPTPDQVEQDLLLSQLICLIAGDDYLGDELVFRGALAFIGCTCIQRAGIPKISTTCVPPPAASAKSPGP